MSVRKVLFIQNQIGFDGRSRISLELIGMLNDLGISPDIATFANRNNTEDYRNGVVKELSFRVLRIWYPFSRGYVPQVLLLNFLSRWKLKNYDVTFNLNDAFYCLPNYGTYVHYISDLIEDNFSWDKGIRGFSFRKYYDLLCGTVCRAMGVNVSGEIIVNSEYTKEKLIKFYPLLEKRIITINPPCIGEEGILSGTAKKIYDVVSVGTFSPEKGQLQLIDIARCQRNLRFAVVGSVWNKRYFLECLKYKESEGLRNVDLFPNLARPRLQELLEQSRVLFHYKRQEGFGISTVEGIARGCIPIVPDSGGQREVVPFSELRFEKDEEIPEKLKQVIEWDREKTNRYIEVLQEHIRRFTNQAFRRKMKPMLSQVILASSR